MAKRRVAVVTGTRAEYGLLRSVMDAIEARKELELQVVVTGMHLLKRFGYTVKEIEADGRRIDARVPLQSDKDDAVEQSRGMGRAITGMSDAFARLRTDIVVVLGDRMEMFAAAATATASQLVLAHIHGGEAAQGVQDEAYRHAITKLGHIHFAASKGAAGRLRRLGEESFRIYQTGSPGLDGLLEGACQDVDELSKWAKLDAGADFLMVLQHSAGGSAAVEERRMRGTLAGCRRNRLPVLVLHPNCDPGFSGILRAARGVCGKLGWPLVKHIPRSVFVGLLRRTRILAGNSSGGIIEAGYLNVDVLNIGPRQYGREHGSNVRDVGYGAVPVGAAVAEMLGRKRSRRRPCMIYGDGQSGPRIAKVLASVRLDERLRRKRIAY